MVITWKPSTFKNRPYPPLFSTKFSVVSLSNSYPCKIIDQFTAINFLQRLLHLWISLSGKDLSLFFSPLSSTYHILICSSPYQFHYLVLRRMHAVEINALFGGKIEVYIRAKRYLLFSS